ncbi:unnamed protein product [marine sediment metagenome]|uniref:Uncharacterized protein n=1 Tax=marine sediment metagenome TaxID=412755 RepID=X1TFQ0_9ZZZZ
MDLSISLVMKFVFFVAENYKNNIVKFEIRISKSETNSNFKFYNVLNAARDEL